MSDWREAHVGPEGDDVTIDGVEVWRWGWRATGEDAVRLPHPSHRDQRHVFQVYEAGPPGGPVRFAAGELSNGVWGFYVPA